jgi:hypothetical protein
MSSVDVRRSDAGDRPAFEVVVAEEGGRSTHTVTLDPSDFDRLHRGDETPEQFVERCFAFLLEREPKESILGSFDVSVISRYFPEFEKEIAR